MNSFLKLMLLVKDYAFQLQFWGLWSKSAYRTDDFMAASRKADIFFEELVSYYQGKTGKNVDFTGFSFKPIAYKSGYFTRLEEEVQELASDAPPDLLHYTVAFSIMYSTLRLRVNNS